MNIQNVVSLAKQAGQKINKANRLQEGLSRLLSVFSSRKQQDDARLQKAARLSCKFIVEGLKKMNSAIPVITPEDRDTPYSERMNWGYVWLVDPLNGSEAFVNHNGNFTG